MAPASACLQCRTSKVKCDGKLPACSRCVRRRTACTGSPSSGGLIFRDERQIAQRNSQRARREGAFANTRSESSSDCCSCEGHGDPGVTPGRECEQCDQISASPPPGPLRRDLNARAVDRFFNDWILLPGDDGFSPGHMHVLPMLYHKAPSGSLLWHAVRAMAFAGIGRARDSEGIRFNVRARSSYGSALTRMISISQDDALLAEDGNFAALLLIDSFESLHLGSSVPLGPHSAAVKHIMSIKNEDQMHNPSTFALWRMANCRLQAKQIQEGEDSDAFQENLIHILGAGQPDSRIVSDILEMTAFCAQAKRMLLHADTYDVESILSLLRKIEIQFEGMDAWPSETTDLWKPSWEQETHTTSIPEHSLAHYHGLPSLSYTNIWFAYIWNFHRACQILLHDRYALLSMGVRISPCEEDVSSRERQVVETLAGSILQSAPSLLGFKNKVEQQGKGTVAARFLAMFSIQVVKDSTLTSPRQKTAAREIIAYIHKAHSLD